MHNEHARKGGQNEYEPPPPPFISVDDYAHWPDDRSSNASRRVRHIGVRCGDAAVRQASRPGAGDETDDVATIIKRMKDEERKIRNRASAHRSNERSRAVREALGKELRVLRGKVCELRLIEKRLRDDNLRMRNVLQGSGRRR